MKNSIKHRLSSLGVLPHVDLFRRVPKIAGWLSQGCSGVAPAPVKRMVLSAHLRRHGLTRFIETGTHLGETTAYIARNKKIDVTSIELDDAYCRAAQLRFHRYPNVAILHGDSARLLPALVRDLSGPALFWLDGHYSGADTGIGNFDTPISAELETIFDSPIKGHVILIDDARCFDGTHDYPHLSLLLESVRKRAAYKVEVSADIIRLTPLN